jgi:hypothetical protein
MANYYSVKCSYQLEQYYHRRQSSHDHNTQAQFVTDAKAAAAAAWGTTTDNISTSNIQQNVSDTKVNSIEI